MVHSNEAWLQKVKQLRDLVRAAPDDDLEQVLVDALNDLCAMHLGDIRDVETTCTRIATARAGVGPAAANLAQDDSRQVDLRGYAAVVAAIAFRRSSDGMSSRAALKHLASLEGVPWPHGDALRFHLESLTYSGGSAQDLRTGLRLSSKANAACPDSPGLQHALAEFQLECAIWDTESDSERDALLDSAADLVAQAIDGQQNSEPWAKFYFTRARILLRKAKTRSQFRSAMGELDTAIGLEARQSVDSGDRRARYQYEKTLAEMRLAIEELATDTELRIEKEILHQSRRSQVQVVAAVGFLTSLLALLQFAAALFVTANKAALTTQDAYVYLLVSIVVMALILFGSVAFAVWYLSRQARA